MTLCVSLTLHKYRIQVTKMSSATRTPQLVGHKPSREYGKRPYVDVEPKDYVQYALRPTDKEIFDVKLEPHSEFKKPYRFDDYQEMEHYYDTPITWSDIGGPGGGNTGGGPLADWWSISWANPSPAADEDNKFGWIGWYITGCIMECFPTLLQGNNCTEEQCCEFNPAWQTITGVTVLEEGAPVEFTRSNVDTWVNGLSTGEVVYDPRTHLPIGHKEGKTGFCFKLTSGAGTGSFTIRAEVDTLEGQARVSGCEQKISYQCCTCDQGENPFTLDEDSSSDVVAPGGSITIYIDGGCPPYSWTVSGTGYSFTSATTTGTTNTLNLAAGT